MLLKNREEKSPVWQISSDLLNPVTIILAHRQSLTRAGVRSLLQDIVGIQIVGETDEGQEVLQLIAAKRPDIVLIDNALSGPKGPDLSAQIKNDFPEVRIIILSLDGSSHYVCKALHAGASAYILSDVDGDELCLAILSAIRGGIYLGTSVSRPSFTDMLSGESSAAETPAPEKSSLDSFSPRHREVLQMIVEGFSVKKIARHLNLSVKTVEAHRRQIMDKLEIQTIADLVRYAMRSGIIR
ncbi:MAG: response regulator transcription factor [Thermodesulfovibrionales bacterium]|nr:response regulator transcription factor [Thermodesulfovibrionales bacterium]